MASKLLAKSVTEGEGGTYDFTCPGVQGHPCGPRFGEGTFTSMGWPTKNAALARGAQHFAEHKGEGPMQELDEFRTDQGLTVVDGAAVMLSDL